MRILKNTGGVKGSESFPGGSDGKASACNRETWVQSLGWEDLLEKEMATHYSIIAWRIPQMEENGRIQSMLFKTGSVLLFLFHLCQCPIL